MGRLFTQSAFLLVPLVSAIKQNLASKTGL